jgi:F-type H+-transporting ATPase subunit gamma
MATLKEISMRLASTKNIQKITASMKMVSAAKFARAERNLLAARALGPASTAVLDKTEIDLTGEKRLLVTMSSDRGLCGGIHSYQAKMVHRMLSESNVETRIVSVGDKTRGILGRLVADQFLVTVSDVGKSPPTFRDAANVAEAILASGYEYDHGSIIFNKFKNMVSYDTTSRPIITPKIEEAEEISAYEEVDAETVEAYTQFNLAASMFYTMLEAQASEQSARMSAMDNATSNAGDMIDKLTLTFNRTRQAVITRELIEIISGAAALD